MVSVLLLRGPWLMHPARIELHLQSPSPIAPAGELWFRCEIVATMLNQDKVCLDYHGCQACDSLLAVLVNRKDAVKVFALSDATCFAAAVQTPSSYSIRCCVTKALWCACALANQSLLKSSSFLLHAVLPVGV